MAGLAKIPTLSRVFQPDAFKKPDKLIISPGLALKLRHLLFRNPRKACTCINSPGLKIGHTPQKFPVSGTATSCINAYLCSYLKHA